MKGLIKLNIEQVHARLLEMAKTVNTICARHKIPIYMLAGTMLGAIRHKGFIPWDDDMDFAVPFGHYYDLISILKKELPKQFSCLTYDTSDNCFVPWIKVEDTETIVNENSQTLPFEKMPGITLDIFPLVSCDHRYCTRTVERIQKLFNLNRTLFMRSTDYNNPWKNHCKKILRFITPFSSRNINNQIMHLTETILAGNDFVIPMDPNYHNRYFPKEWFVPPTQFVFEEELFTGMPCYHEYLTVIYHDYLKLPPKEMQRIHCDNCYLRTEMSDNGCQ